MPARGPVVHVTTATRLPAASFERLTLEGAPMPRTTSHSVWPSATVPPMGAGVVDALASAGPADGAMPGGGRHAGTAAIGAHQTLSSDRLVGGQRRRFDRDVLDQQPARLVEPF